MSPSLIAFEQGSPLKQGKDEEGVEAAWATVAQVEFSCIPRITSNLPEYRRGFIASDDHYFHQSLSTYNLPRLDSIFAVWS
jgi:hypothetical protein